MKLYDSINDSGLVSEINRICGSTNLSYSVKAKISRLNDAIDWYFNLAFQEDSSGPFDDSNQIAAPIETQDLVAGTNQYKFSAFANEVLNVLKLTVIDQNGKEVPLLHESLVHDPTNIYYNNFGELYKTSVTGIPRYWTRLGDFIYLRPTPIVGTVTLTAGLKAYVERTSTKFTFNTITSISNGASALVTTPVAHGLVAGDTVIFETDGTLPAGLTPDTVQYYVIASGLTSLTFEVSTSLNGSAVTTSSAGSGSHTFVQTSKVPGIPTIHHVHLARQASYPFCAEHNLPQAGGRLRNGAFTGLLMQIKDDESDILDYFSKREKDIPYKITPIYRRPR